MAIIPHSGPPSGNYTTQGATQWQLYHTRGYPVAMIPHRRPPNGNYTTQGATQWQRYHCFKNASQIPLQVSEGAAAMWIFTKYLLLQYCGLLGELIESSQ